MKPYLIALYVGFISIATISRSIAQSADGTGTLNDLQTLTRRLDTVEKENRRLTNEI